MEAVNSSYLERRENACLAYSAIFAGDKGNAETDEDIFNQYFVDRSECDVRTFTISPQEIQVLHDALALMNKSYDELWAAYNALRHRHFDLQDVLRQVRDMP